MLTVYLLKIYVDLIMFELLRVKNRYYLYGQLLFSKFTSKSQQKPFSSLKFQQNYFQKAKIFKIRQTKIKNQKKFTSVYLFSSAFTLRASHASLLA